MPGQQEHPTTIKNTCSLSIANAQRFPALRTNEGYRAIGDPNVVLGIFPFAVLGFGAHAD